MSAGSMINTEEIKAIATGFLMKSEQVRSVVAALITDHPAAAAAAMIAGQFAIEDAMTDADKAFIQKCVHRKKILCEGSSTTPPMDAIYAVIAEAESKQLDFGSTQYSVWGKGTFYAKEGAYRKWFSLRTDCSHLDVNPGLPEWRVLKDKSMWVIPGEASVAVSGEIVSVKCVVGINGSATDIIANIEAKATRALLKRLWSKVSSISLDDSEDQIIEDTVQQTPARIDAKPTQQATEPEPFETQIEKATKPIHLDVIARAIVAAKLSDDETGFLKTMVQTARERLRVAK